MLYNNLSKIDINRIASSADRGLSSFIKKQVAQKAELQLKTHGCVIVEEIQNSIVVFATTAELNAYKAEQIKAEQEQSVVSQVELG